MTAQAVTITEPDAGYSEFQKLRKIKWAWKCTDAGLVTGSVTTGKYTGEIVRLITKPVDGPTDNYDVAINDDDGVDVLMGAGIDRDTTNTEQKLASVLGVCVDSKLTLEITGAGNAKSGIVFLYIK